MTKSFHMYGPKIRIRKDATLCVIVTEVMKLFTGTMTKLVVRRKDRVQFVNLVRLCDRKHLYQQALDYIYMLFTTYLMFLYDNRLTEILPNEDGRIVLGYKIYVNYGC